jgi:DNA-binding GntR family transcriptional regulator
MKTPLPQTKEGRGLTNWVTASLREAIFNGHFEPGEKLDQDLIADELNVSRTPIREALKVLESEGFVEIRSYRGAYITLITRQDIRDVYEIRSLIEAEMVRQATPVIPDSVLNDLEDLMKEDRLAFETGLSKQHYAIDQRFHDAIAGYCPNKLFTEILDKLNNRIVRVRSFALNQPGTHLEKSHDEHMAIVRAMRSRNAELAGQLMFQHLKDSAARIEEFIR